jgi:cell division protein FtsQ
VRHLRRRTVLLAVVVAVLMGAGWMWLRDSSLVAVQHVTVTGATGPDAVRIESALRTAAQDMTTLHLRQGELRTAAAPYPIVKSVSATTQFPHGLTVHVVERVPVGAVSGGAAPVAVAGDGTVLRGTPAAGLPPIAASTPPAGDRLTSRSTLRLAALLAAAPAPLRAKVTRAFLGPRGLTVALTDGPKAYFGSGSRLAAKWISLAAVLSDPNAQGASYVDVRLPERPAAGGLTSPPASATTPTHPQP